jgi:hypothetical protein
MLNMLLSALWKLKYEIAPNPKLDSFVWLSFWVFHINGRIYVYTVLFGGRISVEDNWMKEGDSESSVGGTSITKIFRIGTLRQCCKSKKVNGVGGTRREGNANDYLYVLGKVL